MAKVKIEGCMGCQICVGIEPEVFEWGDDWSAHCIFGDEDIPEKYMDNVRLASDTCPARTAILIEE